MFSADVGSSKDVAAHNRQSVTATPHAIDSCTNKSGKIFHTTKDTVKRHGSGGSASSPDHEDFVMVPADMTKDAAEVRKHNRDTFG